MRAPAGTPGQTLIVTFGCGRVQREGGPIEEIRAGDIVWFSPGEKHWHGAAPTTAVTHIAIAEAANNEVLVVIGPGQIGQAIARRVGFGKHVLLADKRQENANAAAEVLGNAGYDVSVKAVDVSSREDVHALVESAMGLGQVTGLVHAAGVSPSQASVPLGWVGPYRPLFCPSAPF